MSDCPPRPRTATQGRQRGLGLGGGRERVPLVTVLATNERKHCAAAGRIRTAVVTSTNETLSLFRQLRQYRRDFPPSARPPPETVRRGAHWYAVPVGFPPRARNTRGGRRGHGRDRAHPLTFSTVPRPPATATASHALHLLHAVLRTAPEVPSLFPPGWTRSARSWSPRSCSSCAGSTDTASACCRPRPLGRDHRKYGVEREHYAARRQRPAGRGSRRRLGRAVSPERRTPRGGDDRADHHHDVRCRRTPTTSRPCGVPPSSVTSGCCANSRIIRLECDSPIPYAAGHT